MKSADKKKKKVEKKAEPNIPNASDRMIRMHELIKKEGK